tara:strand:- start:120 stop:704 length:585 start_codon:yes stop_codon:yes gene_type:complete
MAITRLGPNQLVNLASNVTGTLPAANVANSTLNNVTALPAAIPTGKILQVVTSENAYANSHTSSSYQDINSASGTVWTTAITPAATSSKILITTSIYIYWEENGNTSNRGDVGVDYKIGSGSYTEVQTGMAGNYDYGGSGVQHRTRHCFNYLISPSTTSAVTVKFKYNTAQGCTGVVNDGGNADSNCTLWEIAG